MQPGESLSLGLQDALERTLSNPTAIHRWHRLLALYQSEATNAGRAWVQQQLRDRVADGGEVGFFRATWLAAVTGEQAYVARASEILLSLEPFDADRLMAFSVYQWGQHVMGGGGHAQLVDTLRGARIPALMNRMGQALLPCSVLRARTVDRLERVALVAPFIGTASHPPTVLAFAHAALLRDAGLQVHVFSSQELRVQHMAEYLANQGEVMTPPPDREQLMSLIPAGIGLTLSDDRFSLQRRWVDSLATIAAFDPDLIVFVGFYSPLTTALIAARPVLGVGIHAMAPMAAVDVWLTSDPTQAGQCSSVWGDTMPPAWAYYHPYRVALKPSSQPLTRAQLGLPADAVVWVSVGARLVHEIEGPWAQRMSSLLALNPQVVWLLVGGTGQLPPALADRSGAQVRVLPHHGDVRSVLRCTDIYINPQRTGGGFSVAEAMAEGVATVALAGSDGGDKLGDAASADLDAFCETLHKYTHDPVARRHCGQAMQAAFRDRLDLSHSGPSLLAACQFTLARRYSTG